MNANQTPAKFDDGMADLLGYNPVWNWVMVFIVLAIIMVTVFFILRLKTSKEGEPVKSEPKGTPVLFVGEIDKAFLLASNHVISKQEACQRVSIILREYLHVVAGIPAGSMTVTDLEKLQAPPRIVENIKYLYPVIFGDRKITTDEEFIKFMNSSRAVIEGNWN